MERRYKLNEALQKVLGSKNVYFQPSENVKIQYDCIIYKRGKARKIRADNKRYINHDFYELVAITRNPDSHIVDDLEQAFEYCEHQRSYITNGLYHHVIYLYY